MSVDPEKISTIPRAFVFCPRHRFNVQPNLNNLNQSSYEVLSRRTPSARTSDRWNNPGPDTCTFFNIQTCQEASVFCLSKLKCPTTFRSSKRSMFSTKHGNGNYSSDSRHFAGCLSHCHCLSRSKLACTSDNGSLSGQGAGWVVGDKVDSASEHMQIELQMNFAGEKHRQIGR